MTTAKTLFAFPKTCKVNGLVHFVTIKLLKFTKNAKVQLRIKVTLNDTIFVDELIIIFADITSNAFDSIIEHANTSIVNAIGDMNNNKLSGSNLSFSSAKINPCKTDFKALIKVAVIHATKPYELNIGSFLLAITTPTVTGINIIYVSIASFLCNITYDKMAVKSGVVADIA